MSDDKYCLVHKGCTCECSEGVTTLRSGGRIVVIPTELWESYIKKRKEQDKERL